MWVLIIVLSVLLIVLFFRVYESSKDMLMSNESSKDMFMSNESSKDMLMSNALNKSNAGSVSLTGGYYYGPAFNPSRGYYRDYYPAVGHGPWNTAPFLGLDPSPSPVPVPIPASASSTVTRGGAYGDPDNGYGDVNNDVDDTLWSPSIRVGDDGGEVGPYRYPYAGDDPKFLQYWNYLYRLRNNVDFYRIPYYRVPYGIRY
jgi:hypothetical protein